MTIDTKNLRVLAENALPAPWEAPDATVPYNSRRELKDAMTPTVVIGLLDALERKDALLKQAEEAVRAFLIGNEISASEAPEWWSTIEAITKEQA